MGVKVVWVERPDTALQALAEVLEDGIRSCLSSGPKGDTTDQLIVRISVHRVEAFLQNGCSPQQLALSPVQGQQTKRIQLLACAPMKEASTQRLLQVGWMERIRARGLLPYIGISMAIIHCSLFVLLSLPFVSPALKVVDPSVPGHRELTFKAKPAWSIWILATSYCLIIFVAAHFMCISLFRMALCSFDILVIFVNGLLHATILAMNQLVLQSHVGNFSLGLLFAWIMYHAGEIILLVMMCTGDAWLAPRWLKSAALACSLGSYLVFFLQHRFSSEDGLLGKEYCYFNIIGLECMTLDSAKATTAFNIIAFHVKILYSYIKDSHLALLKSDYELFYEQIPDNPGFDDNLAAATQVRKDETSSHEKFDDNLAAATQVRKDETSSHEIVSLSDDMMLINATIGRKALPLRFSL